jgi:hypothetical protein
MKLKTFKILQKIESLCSLIDESGELFLEEREIMRRKANLKHRIEDETNQILSDPDYRVITGEDGRKYDNKK